MPKLWCNKGEISLSMLVSYSVQKKNVLNQLILCYMRDEAWKPWCNCNDIDNNSLFFFNCSTHYPHKSNHKIWHNKRFHTMHNFFLFWHMNSVHDSHATSTWIQSSWISCMSITMLYQALKFCMPYLTLYSLVIQRCISEEGINCLR